MLPVRRGRHVSWCLWFVGNFDVKPSVFACSVGWHYNSRPICDPNYGYVILHERYVVTQVYGFQYFGVILK